MSILEYCSDRTNSRHAARNAMVAQRAWQPQRAQSIRRIGQDGEVPTGGRRKMRISMERP